MTGPRKRMEELAAAAILGVDRAGGVDARGLLGGAAVAGARIRAGMVPSKVNVEHEACGEETRPVCSGRAAEILVRALGDREIASEWGRLAAARGVRVPSRLAPAILAEVWKWVGGDAVLVEAAGEVGRWLARLNGVSGKAVVALEQAEEAWGTGTNSERRHLLVRMRAIDAARARALVESTWKDEGADARRAFLEAMDASGLTPEDEPLLERALTDRSKPVRELAAAMLPRLAGSKYVERMTARAAGMIRVVESKKGLVLKKKVVKVVAEPPAEWDPALAKEGIEEKPPQGMGKRAYWLRQIVATVPVGHWTRSLGLSAEELIAGVSGDDYERDVIEAWSVAAARSGDEEWCRGLALQGVRKKKGRAADLHGLWQGLEPRARESVVRAQVSELKGGWVEAWEVLATVEHAWSRAFSKEMVARLGESLPTKKVDHWDVGFQVHAIGTRIDPSLATEFEAVVEKVFKGEVPPSVAASLARLRLRAEMHKEFAA